MPEQVDPYSTAEQGIIGDYFKQVDPEALGPPFSGAVDLPPAHEGSLFLGHDDVHRETAAAVDFGLPLEDDSALRPNKITIINDGNIDVGIPVVNITRPAGLKAQFRVNVDRLQRKLIGEKPLVERGAV